MLRPYEYGFLNTGTPTKKKDRFQPLNSFRFQKCTRHCPERRGVEEKTSFMDRQISIGHKKTTCDSQNK